jgi:hypothetical protein
MLSLEVRRLLLKFNSPSWSRLSNISVLRIRDPVPFLPLDPGSRIGFFRISDPGYQTHISEA